MKSKIIITSIVLALVLIITGCTNSNTVINNSDMQIAITNSYDVYESYTSEAHSIIPVETTTESYSTAINETFFNSCEYLIDDYENTQPSFNHQLLPTVIDGNFEAAYAKALSDGFKSPSEETYNLLIKFQDKIENEPRFVIVDDEISIIWTNHDMHLVIDGNETDLKVSNSIYMEDLPSIPDSLDELQKSYEDYTHQNYGIAENAFLEDLSKKMNSLYLYKVRFYQNSSNACAVYSLTENGDLYINDITAEEFFLK